MNVLLCVGALATLGASASAATVPFVETFATGSSNWRDAAGAGAAAWNAAGGPDGSGYITGPTNVNAAAFGTVIALRGQSGFGSSGGAFVGNWISQGVSLFSFAVRHNAPEPLTIGVRFASAANFPGAVGIGFVPVLPNTWTTVQIAIAPGNPQFVNFEGSDFATVFSNIANIQLAYSVPASLAGTGTVVQFDADNVSIVPGPGAAGAVLIFSAGLGLRRRRSGVGVQA